MLATEEPMLRVGTVYSDVIPLAAPLTCTAYAPIAHIDEFDMGGFRMGLRRRWPRPVGAMRITDPPSAPIATMWQSVIYECNHIRL